MWHEWHRGRLSCAARHWYPPHPGVYYPEIKSFSLSVSRPLILGFRGEGGRFKKNRLERERGIECEQGEEGRWCEGKNQLGVK